MISMKKTAIVAALGFSVFAGAAQAAPILDFSFAGNFLMFDGTVVTQADLDAAAAAAADPANANYNPGYDQTVDGPFLTTSPFGAPMNTGISPAGDPISGTMHMDYNLNGGMGAGGASMTPGALFYGSAWAAHDFVLTGTASPGLVNASMLFDWGGSTAPGNTSGAGGTEAPATACGVVNCDIGVSVTFQMYPTDANGTPLNVQQSNWYGFYTTATSMPAGPFAGKNATFSGLATVTGMSDPVAAVPVPAAAWLLGSGLLGLVGVARRKVALA